MILGCLFLAWLFLPAKPEPVSIQPTAGLVEQVATVKQSLTVQPIENLEKFDHVPDEVKETAVRISEMRAKLDHIPEAGKKVDHIGDANKKVEAKKEIVIFSIDGCKPCKDWVTIEQPKFQKAGWKVVKSDDPMTGPWPHFMIETNGKKIEHRSYLLFDKINEVLK